MLEEKEAGVSHQSEGSTWHPGTSYRRRRSGAVGLILHAKIEFGGWMIESTPSRPYGNYASDLLRVEKNMVLRRRRLLAALSANEIAPTVTFLSTYCCTPFFDKERCSVSDSLFSFDGCWRIHS
jgi:hypothetical protein